MGNALRLQDGDLINLFDSFFIFDRPYSRQLAVYALINPCACNKTTETKLSQDRVQIIPEEFGSFSGTSFGCQIGADRWLSVHACEREREKERDRVFNMILGIT